MSPPTVITRPLSMTENFLRSRTATGFYKNFQVTATYSQDLTSDISLLYRALRKTILDYHILVCYIVRNKSIGRCVYTPISQTQLKDLLIFKDSSYIEGNVINEKFMKEANDIVFDIYEGSPLFRLILVGKYDLSVVLEHTIADGVVGNYFHEIFLQNLAYVDYPSNARGYEVNYGFHEAAVGDISENSIIFNYEKDRALIKNNLPPPIDDFLADPELDYTDNDPLYFDKVIPEEFPNKWPGKFLATRDFGISFKLINFSPSETKEILAACRREKVTITSYIEVITVLTLQPIFGDDHYTTHKIALALRRHYNPELASDEYKQLLSDKSYKILGALANNGVSENLPPIYEFSWDLARRINKNLLRTTQNKKILNLLNPFKKMAHGLEDNLHFFESQLGKPKNDSLKISNLGLINIPVYEIPDKKPWTIKNMIFSQSMSPPASEFMLNVVSMAEGGLNFVLSYDDRFNDIQFNESQNFVTDLKQNMLKYSNDSYRTS